MRVCLVTVVIGLYYRAFHGKQLSAVRREFPILFSKTTETVHKLGFPDVILPGMETGRG